MAEGIFRRHWFPPARKPHAPPPAAPAAVLVPLRKRPTALSGVFRRRRKWFPPRHKPRAIAPTAAVATTVPFRKRPAALAPVFRCREWQPPRRKPRAIFPVGVGAAASPFHKRPTALSAVFRRREPWFPPPRTPHPPLLPPPVANTALPSRKRPTALAVMRRRRKWRPQRPVAPTLGLVSLTFGFARHYTGILTPLGTKRVDYYARFDAPPPPVLAQVAGGTLAARTYYVAASYVSPSGETTASAEAALALAAGTLLRVASPGMAGNAIGWNVYVATASGAETRQNPEPLAIGSDWTEAPSGLLAGAAPPSANTTGWDVFDRFVPDPVTAARYTTMPIDTGFDDDLRVQAQYVTDLGPGESGAPAIAFSIDTWLGDQTEPYVFTLWTIGFVNMRHLRGRLDYAPILPGAVSYLKDFTITIDTSPRIETGGSFDVAPGGSVLTFPTHFHFPPFMPAPNVLSPSGGGYYATATNVSATRVTITIFDHTGTSVAGTVSWSATGE
jgi:hypothetical protein